MGTRVRHVTFFRAERQRRKKETLGNVQMFSPEMYPGPTILGLPPIGGTGPSCNNVVIVVTVVIVVIKIIVVTVVILAIVVIVVIAVIVVIVVTVVIVVSTLSIVWKKQ